MFNHTWLLALSFIGISFPFFAQEGSDSLYTDPPGVDSLEGEYILLNEDYYDSIAPGNYHYHINGTLEFPQGSTFHFELMKVDSVLTSRYTYSCALQNTSFTNEGGFTFNQADHTFSFSPGNFDEPSLLLHIWLEKDGVLSKQIYFQK